MRIFKIGEPIPKTWLHFEFDIADMKKYSNNAVVSDKAELDRLVGKYLNGINDTAFEEAAINDELVKEVENIMVAGDWNMTKQIIALVEKDFKGRAIKAVEAIPIKFLTLSARKPPARVINDAVKAIREL